MSIKVLEIKNLDYGNRYAYDRGKRPAKLTKTRAITMPSGSFISAIHARRLGRSGPLLAVAALAIGTLAACGGVNNGASSATSSGTAGATGGTATTKAAAGGTLTVQFNSPVSLNPALEGTSESDIVFGALDYDSLIYQLGDGTFVPDLATSWGYVAGTQNEVFNLTLRGGVDFSDGSLMTPQSVVNSFNYFKKADGPQAGYLACLPPRPRSPARARSS